MDLLEYQGKQLFAKHGVPVPDGRPATTVQKAVEAAEQLGYPVVVKAQVQIGGRGKAGGIKLAGNRREAEEHATAILGMDIRGFTVHELYVEKASEIDEEYYAAIVFDRSAKKPMAMLSKMGGMDVEEVAETDPQAMRMLHVDPLLGLQDFHGRRLARRGEPPARDEEPRGGGTRREGHGRRQRAVPPSGGGRDARRLGGGPAGADGEGARPNVREARRERRDPRQRRRARDVHARRRGPGRRQARELPRRRRRLEG